MQQHDLLRRIGLSEDTIQQLTNRHMIEVKGSDYIICDADLLYEIILTALDRSIDPKGLLIPDMITSYDNDLDLLYRYMSEGNFTMARDIIEYLMKTLPTGGLSLLHSKFENSLDTNVYILKESTFKNDVITDGLHKMERKLLRQMEVYNYADALDTLEKLSSIYAEEQVTPFFHNVYGLLAAITDMTNDHTMISRMDPNAYTGELNNILSLLVSNGDYYRCQELIAKGMRNNENSIEWKIYDILMTQVMYIHNKNYEASKLRSIVDASISDEPASAFPEETYPKITKQQIKEIETTDLEEYDSHDYYAEYEEAYFVEHDYEKAKQMLLKHMKQEAINGMSNNYNYLLDELKILLENEKHGVDMYHYNTSSEFAFGYLKEEDYASALNYCARMHNLLPVKTPRIYVMIAECYRHLNNLEKAYQFYIKAFEGAISPYDLENMMEVCFAVGDYDTTVNVLGRYEFYNPNENVRVHYMAAAAYYQMKMFDSCEEQLDICTEILDEEENLPITFKEEREAIKKAKAGYAGEFIVDDYIDYQNTEADDMLIEFLDENYEHASSLFNSMEEETNGARLSNNIEYILRVARLLFQANRYDDGLELVYGVDPYLEESIIAPEEVKKYIRISNNLKSL